MAQAQQNYLLSSTIFQEPCATVLSVHSTIENVSFPSIIDSLLLRWAVQIRRRRGLNTVWIPSRFLPFSRTGSCQSLPFFFSSFSSELWQFKIDPFVDTSRIVSHVIKAESVGHENSRGSSPNGNIRNKAAFLQ